MDRMESRIPVLFGRYRRHSLEEHEGISIDPAGHSSGLSYCRALLRRVHGEERQVVSRTEALALLQGLCCRSNLPSPA